MELETIRAFKLACMRIYSCINDFQGVTGRTGFGISRTESRSFGSGADDRSVLMEGELLDSCCNGCQKKMLPNTQSIEGL